jgi:hypothetical protein
MSKGDLVIEEAKEESEEKDSEEEKHLAAPKEVEENGEIVPEEDILPFAPELLEAATPEVKRATQIAFSMMRFGGAITNPMAAAIAKVLDRDHVTDLIQLMDRGTEMELSSAREARRTNLLYLIVVLIFAAFALWILRDSNPELLRSLVNTVATLAGGLGAGYGIKAWIDERRQ